MKRFITRKRKNIVNLKYFIICFIFLFSIIMSLKILNNIDDDKVTSYLLSETMGINKNDIQFIDLMNFNLASSESILKNTISTIGSIEPVNNIIDEDKMVKEPILYIYNTHQQEEYLAGNLANYNISPTVYMVSNILSKELEKYDIYSIVEDENIKDVLNENGWGYNNSYRASRIWINNIKNSYPSIKYFIDVHRDSVSLSTVINNKKYARMMLVLGMDYDTYEENEGLMIKINDYLNNNYSGISRDILYAKKNVFNQDLDPNIFLVEIGGNESGFEEVYNSVLVLAEALSYVIGENNGR